jgi:hypothetical protein
MNVRPEEPAKESRLSVSQIPVKRLVLIGCIVSFIAAVGFSIFYSSASHRSRVTYEGKSLERWFYAGGTNFLAEDKERENAFRAVGTNAFAFLLSNLRERRGNSLIYFELYRVLPRWTQRRLPYPISGDDIRAISINYLFKLKDVPGTDYGPLAESITKLSSPRLRFFGFGHFMVDRQRDPVFLSLCRKLLNDDNSAIRLTAAIWLADSQSMLDPTDSRLFPLLIDGLQNKAVRDAQQDLCSYAFGQPPGGSGMRRPFPSMPPTNMPDLDDAMQQRIIRALEQLWLRGYLTPEQKELVKRLDKERKANLERKQSKAK